MKKYNLKSAMLFLRSYTHSYLKYFIAFYIGWLAETIIVVLIPKLFGIMLDEIIYEGDIAELLFLCHFIPVFYIIGCMHSIII